eukprot:gnl/MRDRNA2_/MRDRNA2_57478_c0_seq1.p1 gnl/MRDRNA2_/MRDRNA2_57478_c0~~gnl/MRDRNA2_/MRDRNA2_57478_c0_seq1.p1  ORF type:complete len:362 (-),score=28.29 gnl/MRDRNA2_/MRDRNA2_57478_c0_seq1:213-1298(-)
MVVFEYAHAKLLSFRKGMDNHMTFHVSTPSIEVYFWIGIAMMLLGKTLSAVGLLMQKYSHKGEPTTWTCCGRSAALYFTSPMWLCGLVVYILAHILCWVSLALGPQTVLASLTCWSTVVTFVLAPSFLGETVTVFRLISVCVMILGCTWVIFSGPRMYQVSTVELMLLQMQDMLFLMLSGLALLYLLCCAGMAALSNKSPRLSALQYTTIAAVVGWYSVLSAKITSGLTFTSWHHNGNQFDRWESWVMLAIMILLAVANLHFLNMALSIGDAVYVTPLHQAIAIFGQTVLGGIFFQEFQHLDTYGHINFWLGLTCVLVGIICLTRKGPETDFFQYPILGPKSGSTADCSSQDSKLPLSRRP